MEECKFKNPTVGNTTEEIVESWLEQDLWGFRRWNIILMFFSGFLAIVICVCCCCRFRIPRTKQEIEADYIRKKITRKFRRQLRMIQNSEMDEMDLKKALDRIRAEFKSDTESLAHSEVFSMESRPTSPLHTYRKASDIGVNIESLIQQNDNSHPRSRFSTSNLMRFLRRTPASVDL